MCKNGPTYEILIEIGSLQPFCMAMTVLQGLQVDICMSRDRYTFSVTQTESTTSLQLCKTHFAVFGINRSGLQAINVVNYEKLFVTYCIITSCPGNFISFNRWPQCKLPASFTLSAFSHMTATLSADFIHYHSSDFNAWFLCRCLGSNLSLCFISTFTNTQVNSCYVLTYNATINTGEICQYWTCLICEYSRYNLIILFNGRGMDFFLWPNF